MSSRALRSTMTVFTHPSGEDQVMEILNRLCEDDPPKMLVQHVNLGEFEVHATHADLAQAELLLRSVTGVRCVR